MPTVDKKIIKWSDVLLDQLLIYNKHHPSFKFWLRHIDSPKSDTNRLRRGFWFQGSDYIFISPYKRVDADNKTKSIGFVLSFDKNTGLVKSSISVVYGDKENKKIIPFYEDVIVNVLKESLISGKVKYKKYYSSNNIEHNLKEFLEKTVPRINKIIIKYKLQDSFSIGEGEFRKSLKKILNIRDGIKGSKKYPLNDLELNEYPEGEKKEALRKHKWRERNSKFVRDYKKLHINTVHCPACSINPYEVYKIKAIKFLELHHIIPLSKKKLSSKVTVDDVTLLCPNCHRAIHKMMVQDSSDRISLREFQKRLSK